MLTWAQLSFPNLLLFYGKNEGFSFEKKKIYFSFAHIPNGFQEKAVYSDIYHPRISQIQKH